MKKTIVLAFSLLMSLPLLFNSCSNAPQSETTHSDTAKTKDTIVLVKTDTSAIATVTKAENPPPPSPTINLIRPVIIEEQPEEAPPPYDEITGYAGPKTQEAEGPYDYPETVGIGPDPDSKIYTIVDQMPEMYMLKEFLYENITYPEGARDLGYQGVVKIGFVVDLNGKVKDVGVTNTSGNIELDKEAMRVIKKTSGRWKPGRVNGKAVNTQMTLPITFQIDE